jgi:hypothetical protein
MKVDVDFQLLEDEFAAKQAPEVVSGTCVPIVTGLLIKHSGGTAPGAQTSSFTCKASISLSWKNTSKKFVAFARQCIGKLGSLTAFSGRPLLLCWLRPPANYACAVQVSSYRCWRAPRAAPQPADHPGFAWPRRVSWGLCCGQAAAGAKRPAAARVALLTVQRANNVGVFLARQKLSPAAASAAVRRCVGDRGEAGPWPHEDGGSVRLEDEHLTGFLQCLPTAVNAAQRPKP